jgi:hypothetical protein
VTEKLRDLQLRYVSLGVKSLTIKTWKKCVNFRSCFVHTFSSYLSCNYVYQNIAIILSFLNYKKHESLYLPCCILYSNFSTLISLSPSNFIHILKFTLWRLFVSSYYLFNTIYFSLTGHYQVYKIVDENHCSVVTLSYFAFYE